MINEGVKILAEGKAIRASDIDVIWISGYGWPVYRGGPMFYAEQVGLGSVLSRLQDLAKEYGDAFAPAPLLEEMVAEGQSFRDRGF
jgi:3-hydroxyacyl-CoA dehydrogenase